jgi:hypothetical protein
MKVKNIKEFKITLLFNSIFIFIIAVFSYAYLLNIKIDLATTSMGLTVSCGFVSYNDDLNSIHLTNTYPMSDNIGRKTEPYTFSIKNTCATNISYIIYLIIPTTSQINSEFINYEFNNGDKGGTLTTLPNAILSQDLKSQLEFIHGYKIAQVLELSRDILNPNVTNYYNLKLWVNKYATNNEMNKDFILTVATIDETKEIIE